MVFRAESMDLTTPAIDLVTYTQADKTELHSTHIYVTISPHISHLDRRLDSRCHGVHPSAHPHEVQALVLLSDSVLGVNARPLDIPLL